MSNHPYIVFVDDDQDDIDIARWRLAKVGIDATACIVCSTNTLIAALTQQQPDLIISDFSMPGFDGWEALQVAQRLAPSVPFIFHSGTIGAERFRTALERGARGCVDKDHPEEFVELVRQALSGHDGRTLA